MTDLVKFAKKQENVSKKNIKEIRKATQKIRSTY